MNDMAFCINDTISHLYEFNHNTILIWQKQFNMMYTV